MGKKNPKKFLMRSVLVLLMLITVFTCVLFVIKGGNRASSKIVSEYGIQENMYINVNGIAQNVYIRGENVNNPLVLFVHGGPGDPQPFMTYYYQTSIEKEYTIAYWTQRNCGRNYYRNTIIANDNLSGLEQSVNDMDIVIDYLLDRFGQRKIIIIGHSWGTVVSCNYIQENSEKVEAYIGVSQVVSISSGLELTAELLEQALLDAGNEGDLRQYRNLMESLLSGKHKFASTIFSDYLKMKEYISSYLSYPGQISLLQKIWIGATSPNIELDDVRWFSKMMFNTSEFADIQEKNILDTLNFDIYNLSPNYEIPVCFITGAYDFITPYTLVEDYFSAISAPSKEHYTIENAGHSPFIDSPEDFCVVICDYLNSLLK